MEVFLRALERLIDRAAPNLPNYLRNSQLIDYFLEGLPTHVADQLFILAHKTLEDTVTRARRLLLLENRSGLRARRIAGITACEDDDEEDSSSGHIMIGNASDIRWTEHSREDIARGKRGDEADKTECQTSAMFWLW